MNGIRSGRCMLKTTRPTVVSMSFLSSSWISAPDDVLIVELLGEVHEAAADCATNGGQQLDLARLQHDDHFSEVAEGLAPGLGPAGPASTIYVSSFHHVPVNVRRTKL